MGTREVILSLKNELKAHGKMFKHLEVSWLGGVCFTSVFGDLSCEELIYNDVQCGVADGLSLSTLKAMVEYVERVAVREGYENKLEICKDGRSDGVAAYPIGIGGGLDQAKVLARNNALCEAVERYAWAQWWDCDGVKANIYRFDLNGFHNQTAGLSDKNKNLIHEISQLIPVRDIYFVDPQLVDSRFFVRIVFFVFENGGVASGGACGFVGDEEGTLLRALGELARHVSALLKYRTKNIEPLTFYHQRLVFMGALEAEKLFFEKLQNNGSQRIEWTQLAIDKEIPYSLSDSVYVHRCLFENQPPFVGGDLKRLCL